MHGHFFEAFGKQDSESRTIPDDILQNLNKRLPENFKYMKRSDGSYEAVPNENMEGLVFNFELDLDNEPHLKELYNELGADKFIAYIYRIQKAIPAKDIKMGTSDKLESVRKLSSDPLSDEECEITHSMIYPSQFEKPYTIRFESPEGDVVDIDIQQVKYDSLTEIKRENISFPALKIEIYQYSPLTNRLDSGAHTSQTKQIKINYAVIPNRAKTVHEVVVAFHVFKGLVEGTTKMNNTYLTSQEGKITSPTVQMESSMVFWETALKLEKKLNVSFDPSIALSNADLQLFTELDVCMLQGKMIKWNHPFDHFHIDDYQAKDGLDLDNHIMKEKISYAFIEGPISATLLGASFDYYSLTTMDGFKITNIEWEKKGKKGEVYISDSDDNPWVLSRHYCTEQEAKEFIEKINQPKVQ